MVGNFVPLYEPTKGTKRDKLLTDAEQRLAEIAVMIDKCLIVRLGIYGVLRLREAIHI
jgi:hypothetical protein